MTYTCAHSFESSTGHRYDSTDEITLEEYKDLSIEDRTYFEPLQEDHLFPIEQAI